MLTAYSVPRGRRLTLSERVPAAQEESPGWVPGVVGLGGGSVQTAQMAAGPRRLALSHLLGAHRGQRISRLSYPSRRTGLLSVDEFSGLTMLKAPYHQLGASGQPRRSDCSMITSISAGSAV